MPAIPIAESRAPIVVGISATSQISATMATPEVDHGNNAASKTATLQPSASLAASSVYTAQISGIKDPAGNLIGTTYTWSFTAAATAPPTTR